MKPSLKELSNKLRKHDIRPSHPRLKVLDYLLTHLCHPTVDRIYIDLVKEIPTLSKATIYNTLKLFIEAKLVRVLTIEDNETRYDIMVENHGHFKCESCGIIFNFSITIDDFLADDLQAFEIKEKNVYFSGTCPKCLQEKSK